MLHLRLMKEVRSVPLVYVVRQHVKVVHGMLEHDASLKLDEEMIARAPYTMGALLVIHIYKTHFTYRYYLETPFCQLF